MDLLVITTFTINIGLSLLLCFYDPFPYSIRKTTYLFIFSFMGLAPLYQYCNEIATTPGYTGLTAQTYLSVNLFVLMFIATIEFTYKICRVKTAVTNRQLSAVTYEIPIVSYLLMFCISILGFIIFLNRVDFNYIRILLRENLPDLLVNDPFANIYNSLLTPMQAIFALAILLFSNNKKIKFTAVALLLLFCFPLRMARYITAIMYLPIFLYFAHNFFIKHKTFFHLSFIFAICVIFPLMDLFRTIEVDVLTSAFADFNYFDFKFLKSTQFDSYQSFAFVLENEIITNGRQLLGVLFFWIPRSLWVNKPIGSGMFLGEEFALFESGFSNLALNFLGEGYINFGITGCFIFIILFAIIACKLDYLFWIRHTGDLHNSFTMYYFCVIANIFFLLRGTLLAAFSALIGSIIGIYLTTKLIKKESKE